MALGKTLAVAPYDYKHKEWPNNQKRPMTVHASS